MSKENLNSSIYVFADWEFLKETTLMGVLHVENSRGNEIFSFEYNNEWLKSGKAQILDPELTLFTGRQFLSGENGKQNFGIFLDSSPDRWGRVLMRRRETVLSKNEKRVEKKLLETDYLLGVYDEHRMGALRFKKEINGSFLNDNKDIAIPPWTSIRELEEICRKLGAEEAINDPEYSNWLNVIIAPGSSLGGARPKASVLDPENTLWIAKFPKTSDNTDIGAWEMVANKIAKNSGINVAEGKAEKFASKNHTYLSRRFDRLSNGKRLHFASATTMLGYMDGQDYKDGVSYLEIADFISNYGANPNKDLEELWRRIVFNICVSNTDDHLRNHGFILTPMGWVLSPAYDLNPNEMGNCLTLNITENDNSLNLDLAMDIHEYCRLDKNKAKEIINVIRQEVSKWKNIADKYKISKSEQEFKSNAFMI